MESLAFGLVPRSHRRAGARISCNIASLELLKAAEHARGVVQARPAPAPALSVAAAAGSAGEPGQQQQGGIAPFLGFVSYFVSVGATFRAPQNVHFLGWCPCHVSYKNLVNVRFRQHEPPVSFLWGRNSHELET